MDAGLRTLGCVGKRDRQRRMQVLPGACRCREVFRLELRAETARAPARPAEHAAQEFFKPRAAAEPLCSTVRAPEAVRAEAEAFEVPAAAGMKSAAAGLCTETLETLKTRLALRVDLAAVIRLALVAIAADLVGGIEFGEMRGRLRIVLVGIGVQFFGKTPIGALDLGLGRTLGNPQHLVGVAHRIRSPMNPLPPANPAA